MSICSRSINYDFCDKLTVCDHKNCDKFGMIKCFLTFTKEQLNYGEYQDFYIKTVGADDSSVNSANERVKVDLDKVNENDKLKVLIDGDSIKIELAKENLPIGPKEVYLRIKCLDLEYLDEPGNDVFYQCNETICNCQNTLYGSTYDIILQTVKDNSEWEPQEMRLKNQYTTR